MIKKTIIKAGAYYDSITLLQAQGRLLDVEGVLDAAVVMGTPANKSILKDAGLLTSEAESATADDLIIAVQTASEKKAVVALEQAEALLKASRAPKDEDGAGPQPKTVAVAVQKLDGANIALISVAGRYAADVARDALNRDLHVFLFSDNVSVEDEITLKRLGRDKGLLVMGPDAGTAIINGVALGFANAVPKGPVGVVAASGTGLQAVSSTLARMDVGVSQAIGTGGRDLSEAVDGIMMLEGVKALQADSATEVLVLISKPPAPEVAKKVLKQLETSAKPTVVCFLGGKSKAIRKAGGIPAATLEEAAHLAAGLVRGETPDAVLGRICTQDKNLRKSVKKLKKRLQMRQQYIRGLFSGGTFCYESQLILNAMLGKGAVASNAPVKKKQAMKDATVSEGHVAVDLGEDEFTVGRLHPMLDPTLRNRRIVREAQNPETAIILLDIVLGYGVHPDPAGAAIEAIREAQTLLAEEGREVLFIASVCGTAGDPQNAEAQEAKLRDAGVIVLESNAAASRLAGLIVGQF